MEERTPEDRLRQEYFSLLPDIRRVVEHLEAQVRYLLLPVSLVLHKHEQLVITRRIKDCESAIDALRRRQEGRTFQADPPTHYSLRSLPDLAGVRIAAFPRSRVVEINGKVRDEFPHWNADPVRSDPDVGEPLAYKYSGYCDEASTEVRAELQIMSILTARFWEVEHPAIYKPTPSLEGVANSREMRGYVNDVLRSLRTFEEAFEALINRDPARRDR